jgi:hypothetical protein
MHRIGSWARTNDGTIILDLAPALEEEVRSEDVASDIASDTAKGNRNETDLTNKIFFSRHPERRNKPIQRAERGLAAEWVSIRDRIVRPALAARAVTSSSDRWILPDAVRIVGDQQHVAYDPAPEWATGTNCSRQFTAGADELGRYILAQHPGVTHIGGYACRQNTANAAETSVHGTGRAIDVMIPPLGTAANTPVGDPIANWLVQHATAIGVQYVIWNRSSWGGHYKAPKQRSYRGPNPHIDHIHAEITIEAADRRTPWFQGMQYELGERCSCRGCTRQ